MTTLTAQIIEQKTGQTNLNDVVNLNCSCYALADIGIVSQLKNVEILSLSLNKITTLKPFAQNLKLKELYLRKNEIDNLADIEFLRGLPDLTVLWLADNPIAQHPSYRLYVLQQLPNLVKLDNELIPQSEKNAAMAANPIAVHTGSASAAAARPLTALGIGPRPPPLESADPSSGASTPAAAAAAAALSHADLTFAGPPPPSPSPKVAAASDAVAAALRSAGTPSSSPSTAAAATAAAGGQGVSGSVSRSSSSLARPSVNAAVPVPPSPASRASSAAALRASSTEPARAGGSSANILYAIMALLRELDEEGLRIVRSEAEARLSAKDLEGQHGGGGGGAGSNLVSPRP